jgi:hypothetical protein
MYFLQLPSPHRVIFVKVPHFFTLLPVLPSFLHGTGAHIIYINMTGKNRDNDREAASLGNSLELMVLQFRKHSARSPKRVEKLIVGIIHPIDVEHGFEAAFVEGPVVSHKGQTLYQRLYLSPDIRKQRRIVRIIMPQPMHTPAKVVVIVRLRPYQRIKRLRQLAIPHNDNTHRAHTAALAIGRLKVYRRKVKQGSKRLSSKDTHFFLFLRRYRR